jgi:hypothetical protein
MELVAAAIIKKIQGAWASNNRTLSHPSGTFGSHDKFMCLLKPSVFLPTYR